MTQGLGLAGEELGEMNTFGYLDGCISPGGRISDEVSSNIQKAGLALIKPTHVI